MISLIIAAILTILDGYDQQVSKFYNFFAYNMPPLNKDPTLIFYPVEKEEIYLT